MEPTQEPEKRRLFTIDPINGKEVPFTIWRIELTPEQQKQHEEDIKADRLPF